MKGATLYGTSYMGCFAIPRENQDLRFTGILAFSEVGEISLKVVINPLELSDLTQLIETLAQDINDQELIPIIYGYARSQTSSDDLSFTLYDCRLLSYSRSGLISCQLEAKACINKCQIKHKQDFLFRILMLKFKGIDDWVGINGFNVVSPLEEKRLVTTINYEQPELIELFSEGNFKIYFYFRARSPLFSIRGSTGEINQSIYFNVEFDGNKPVDEVIELAESFQNFFSLIFNHSAKLSHIEARLNDLGVSEVSEYVNNVDLVYFNNIGEQSDYEYRRSALFDYADVQKHLPEMLKNWLASVKTFGPAIDQYFSIFHLNQLTAVSRFVSILSVLEIFHGRKKLKANSLKYKVCELIQLVSSRDVHYLKLSKELADNAVLVRKYFVHGTLVESKVYPHMLTREYIAEITIVLENLFKIILLIELGVSAEVLNQSFRKRPWHWQLST